MQPLHPKSCNWWERHNQIFQTPARTRLENLPPSTIHLDPYFEESLMNRIRWHNQRSGTSTSSRPKPYKLPPKFKYAPALHKLKTLTCLWGCQHSRGWTGFPSPTIWMARTTFPVIWGLSSSSGPSLILHMKTLPSTLALNRKQKSHIIQMKLITRWNMDKQIPGQKVNILGEKSHVCDSLITNNTYI